MRSADDRAHSRQSPLISNAAQGLALGVVVNRAGFHAAGSRGMLRGRGACPDAGLVKALLILVRCSPNQQFWRDSAPTGIAWQLAGVALASLALCIEFPPLAWLTHLAAPPVPVAPSAPGGIVSTIWWDSFKP
jgi:hypothetical protein